MHFQFLEIQRNGEPNKAVSSFETGKRIANLVESSGISVCRGSGYGGIESWISGIGLFGWRELVKSCNMKQNT